MHWIFRIVIALMVAAYGAWLIWPVGIVAASGGVEAAARVLDVTGGSTAGAAAAAFLGVCLLYGVSALLAAVRLGGAPLIYLFAASGDILLRLLDPSAAGGSAVLGLATRSREAAASAGLPLDGAALNLILIAVLGLLVCAQSAWHSGRGALTKAWTQFPDFARAS